MLKKYLTGHSSLMRPEKQSLTNENAANNETNISKPLEQTTHYQNVEHLYKTLYFDLIDVSEIRERFSDDLRPISFIYDLLFDEKTKQDLKTVEENLLIYKEIIDFSSLISEVNVWRSFKKNTQNYEFISKNIFELRDFFLKNNFTVLLPNLCKLFRIYLTIAISSATPERSFSCLKRIKTWLRNSMNDDRLSNLSVLNIEKCEIDKIDLNLIVNNFASVKDRKVLFN